MERFSTYCVIKVSKMENKLMDQKGSSVITTLPIAQGILIVSGFFISDSRAYWWCGGWGATG